MPQVSLTAEYKSLFILTVWKKIVCQGKLMPMCHLPHWEMPSLIFRILLSAIMNYLFLHFFSVQFYTFCFKEYLNFREKYIQNWCQGLQPWGAMHFLCFWCYFTDKLLILRCYGHGCRTVLKYISGEEKIRFLSIFRSASLTSGWYLNVSKQETASGFACANSCIQVLCEHTSEILWKCGLWVARSRSRKHGLELNRSSEFWDAFYTGWR